AGRRAGMLGTGSGPGSRGPGSGGSGSDGPGPSGAGAGDAAWASAGAAQQAGAGAEPQAGSPAVTAARLLDRRSPLPLWGQLRADLRRRLDAGAFDDEFPGELALVADYGVSRHTVRSALRDLRAEGVVVAERGRRPRLASHDLIAQPLGTLYSLFALVEAAGLRQTSVVLTPDIRADGVVADRLGLEASTPLFHLERLRLAGGEPLALDRVWLPADLAAPLLEADFTHTALYHELATRAGVRLAGGQEHIRAVTPSRAEQRLLGLPRSVGALAIDRLGDAEGRPGEGGGPPVQGARV